MKDGAAGAHDLRAKGETGAQLTNPVYHIYTICQIKNSKLFVWCELTEAMVDRSDLPFAGNKTANGRVTSDLRDCHASERAYFEARSCCASPDTLNSSALNLEERHVSVGKVDGQNEVPG